MTPCSQRDAWLDGALNREERSAFEVHLATCAECTAVVDAWQSFGKGLIESEAAINPELSAAQVTRLLARAREPRSGMLRWIPIGWVATAMAAAAVVWVVRREDAPQALETRIVAVVEGTASSEAAETTEKGRAVLDIGADRVGVAKATRMEIERADRRATRIHLRRGTIAARVEHARGQRDFTVKTPLGEVHVVGTEFRVSTQEHLLRVEVLQGEVEVKLASGPIRVPAGKQWSLDDSTPHFEPLHAQTFAELESEPAGLGDTSITDAGVMEADAGVVEATSEEPIDGGTRRTRAKVTAPIAEWRTRAARGECSEVVKEAKRWVASHPKEAGAWLVMGDCHRRSNRFAPAIDAYLKAGKQPGDEGEAAMLLAASVMQDNLKQNARALKSLELLVAANPSKAVEAAALVRQARAHQALGRGAKARTILERVVSQFANTPSAAEAAGMLRLK